MEIITVEDLQAFNPEINEVTAKGMIADAIAQARLAAPCLTDEDKLSEDQRAQYKAILRAAIIRWEDAGSGAASSEMLVGGRFTQQRVIGSPGQRRGLLWPSEIDLLRQICGTGRRAGTVDVTPIQTPTSLWNNPDAWTPMYR